MPTKFTKAEQDKGKDLAAKLRFVNLCEPANYVFPSSYVADLNNASVYAANITTAVPWGDVSNHLQRYYEHFRLAEENSKIVGIVDKFSDFEANHKAGRMSFILGLQGLDFIGNNLSFLATFRKLGLLVTTICYNRKNAIGDGIGEPGNGGLSVFGEKVVAELNRVGIVVDFAHVGERTSLEAAKLSKDPVINSHTACAEVNHHIRNVSDELIGAIADTKGVIGIVASPNFVKSDSQPDLHDYVAHMKHIEKVASIDDIGIGLDQYPWKKLGGEEVFMSDIHGRYPELGGGKKFEKLVQGTTDWPDIVTAMVSEGFSDGAVKKVMGENALRVFSRVWK